MIKRIIALFKKNKYNAEELEYIRQAHQLVKSPSDCPTIKNSKVVIHCNDCIVNNLWHHKDVYPGPGKIRKLALLYLKSNS